MSPYLLVLLALLPFTAQAGWLRNFCDFSLVAPDPTQFEGVSESYLTRELNRLKIKVAWKKASNQDRLYIEVIEKELEGRERG